MYGAFGGRLDHTLANLQILAKYGADYNLIFYDEFNKVCLLPRGKNVIFLSQFEQAKGIGIVPIPGKKATLNTTGLKWNIGPEEAV